MKSTIALLAVAGLAAAAGATTVAYTSFEEAATGDKYFDLGDQTVDHDLINNAGEASVDYVSIGGEMGFDSYYRNTRNDVGLTDGDFVGVTNWTGNVGAYTDGDNGFQMSDSDGVMGMSFDTVNGAGMSVALDLFVATTGYEGQDSIRIWIDGDAGVTDLLNTIGSDINDLGIEGAWMTLTADLSAYTSATLYVEFDSNSNSEAMYLDNVIFTPTPGSIALIGLGGLVATRRRR